MKHYSRDKYFDDRLDRNYNNNARYRENFGSGRLDNNSVSPHGRQRFDGADDYPGKGGSYYGNLDNPESRKYSENAGYRENYSKFGEGQWRGNDGNIWPGYTDQKSDHEATGPHKGKGPRSYRRSDERIREEVSERFWDDPYLDASEIEVDVKDGDVILTGVVEDRSSKRRAEDVAEVIAGVINVENRLKVSRKNL